MSAVVTTPRAWPIDRRPAWILAGTVALASAAAVAVAALSTRTTTVVAPAPRTHAEQPAAVAVTGTGPGLVWIAGQSGAAPITSTRPLMDSSFVVAVPHDEIASLRPFSDHTFPLEDQSILSTRPLSDGGSGVPYTGPASGSTNQNAPAMPSCHQCR